MNDINVGDTVRRINLDNGKDIPVGYIGTVDKIGLHSGYISVDGQIWNADYAELVKTKFSIGDKVRRTTYPNGPSIPVGYIGTVTKAITPNPYGPGPDGSVVGIQVDGEYWSEGFAELYEYRVGDTVRRLGDDSRNVPEGYIGKVTKLHDWFDRAGIEVDGLWWWTSNAEPINPWDIPAAVEPTPAPEPLVEEVPIKKEEIDVALFYSHLSTQQLANFARMNVGYAYLGGKIIEFYDAHDNLVHKAPAADVEPVVHFVKKFYNRPIPSGFRKTGPYGYIRKAHSYNPALLTF